MSAFRKNKNNNTFLMKKIVALQVTKVCKGKNIADPLNSGNYPLDAAFSPHQGAFLSI